MADKLVKKIKPSRAKVGLLFIELSRAWEKEFNVGSLRLNQQAFAEFSENYPDLARTIPLVLDLLEELSDTMD